MRVMEGHDVMKKAEEKKEMSLEEGFQALEELIAKLNREDISLEEAFQSYSKGMELLKNCNNQIDLVEKKVTVLSGEGESDDIEL